MASTPATGPGRPASDPRERPARDPRERAARGPDARPAGRRRASHSLDAVVSEAVAILDAEGEAALTFRALAARLGGGVGSIYWYVSSKDELMARAADQVLEGVLRRTDAIAVGDGDPVDALREIAVALYEQIVDRPWLGAFFLRDTDVQPNGLRLFERVGQQLMRLDLSPTQMLDGVTAVMGFVIGVASDRGQDAERADDGTPPWEGLDSADYPFLFAMRDQFLEHDDRAQFLAGLELILSGLALQAGRA